MICIRKLAWYAMAILLFACAATTASADNKSFSIQVPATLPVKSVSFTFDVTFTNNANGNSTFNSIELDWASSSLTVSDAVLKGTTTHASLGAGSALFTGLSPVKAGKSIVVTLTATSAVTGCSAAQVTWSGRAFTGSPAQPSSPFTLNPSPAATMLNPACTLGFVYQPAAAQAGGTITSVPSNPNASQSVGVARFQGTTLDTTFNGPLTLVIKTGTGASGATLTNATPTYADGVASFPNLSIDLPGSGYVLTATSGSLAADSNPFSIYGGTLGCGVPPDTNDNYDSINGSSDFTLDPYQDGTFASTAGGWGLRRGPNLDGAPCVKVDYTFNLDSPNLVASLLWDKSTGQQAAFEYVIVWPMVSVSASTGWAGGRPELSWGVANPRPGTSDYAPALACLGDQLANGTALLPTIPNAPPFNDPSIYPPATYPQYQPGQPAKLCIAQQAFTAMGTDGTGNAIVQYWDKVIDEGDGWVHFNP